VLLGSVSLTYPFGRDQGIYAYAGKLLLEGKMNYQYVFDLKPPGIHFLFAFAQFAFGESMFNTRVFDLIWQTLTGYVIFLIAFRISGNKPVSLVSSFLYIFLYFRLDYWHTLQADGMLNLPFALSVLLLLQNEVKHSFPRLFFAGVLFALALIFKYTVISFLPMLLISMYFFASGLKSLRLKSILAYLAGVVFFSSATLLLYYFSGALGYMLNVQFVQTPIYTSIAYETESMDYISSQIIRLFTISVYAPLIWFSFIGLVWAVIKKKSGYGYLLLSSWLISSLFSLIFQWKFYYYHFLVIIPPLAIGAPLFVTVILPEIKKAARKKLAIPVLIAILCGYSVFAFKPYINNYNNLFSIINGKNSLKDVYQINGVTEDSVFMISKTFRAVDFVNQYTRSIDRIYVWGFDPLIYYLSGRKCTSRFIYNFPLLWKAENTELRKEFIKEIEDNYPKLILVAKNDPLLFISGFDEDSKGLLKRFPEFSEILNEKYINVKSVDDFEFYELKNW
jgi:hypothetical protein